jgi:hypothetical protein
MTAIIFEVPSIYDLCSAANSAAQVASVPSGSIPAASKSNSRFNSIAIIGTVLLIASGICWYLYKQEQARKKHYYDHYLKNNKDKK